MKKPQTLILLISFLVASCVGLVSLSTERQIAANNSIRYDGFFYNEPDLAHIFIYKNGIIYTWVGGPGYLLEDFDKYYSNLDNYETSYDLPYCWGVYNIQGRMINFEKWTSTDAFAPYKTTKFTGEIINDTTLIINHPAKSIGIDTFYFYKFEYKPDSTNKFVK